MRSSNPFATRFTRPGAATFLFPEGQSASALAARLQDIGWLGQIIGPHGSGKSTLLGALAPELEARGRTLIRFTLTQGQTNLDLDPATLSGSTQLILDGFEQLSWLNRRKIKSLARSHRSGLLVTAHSDVGLPTLFETRPTLELAQAVVGRLLPEGDATISPADVEQAFERAGGNLREMLFGLFDVYQARSRQ